MSDFHLCAQRIRPPLVGDQDARYDVFIIIIIIVGDDESVGGNDPPFGSALGISHRLTI